MRHLGIDYGTGKVGLALSDEAGTMGFPKGTLSNDPRLIESLTTLIREQDVTAVVIGDPGEGGVGNAARAFGEALAQAAGVPIHYELEAFSTQEARRAPDGERGNGAVDDRAAALILTSYLSRPHDND